MDYDNPTISEVVMDVHPADAGNRTCTIECNMKDFIEGDTDKILDDTDKVSSVLLYGEEIDLTAQNIRTVADVRSYAELMYPDI